MRSKRTKACEFSTKARQEIHKRDGGRCIFCTMEYKPGGSSFEHALLSIMHYVPRSHGGLGIPQNGAIGCQYHHYMLDNGNTGSRAEMLELFEGYLKQHYPGWNKDECIFRKGM